MNNYNKQAIKFLTDTNTIIDIVECVPQTPPLWAKKGEEHGIKYSVTLKNERHTYTFDYWDSIANKELIEKAKNTDFIFPIRNAKYFHLMDELKSRGITSNIKKNILESLKPDTYSILACLSPLYDDNLDDFCASFGYDSDSITANKIYTACLEQDRHLKKLFTSEQLEILQDIN